MFLGYIHCFRALAILFIVAGHSIDAFSWTSIDTERLLRIFISNGSVLFVFIAGYLFQHLSGKFSPKKYYRSKVKNVISPYFIISIPAIAVFVSLLERDSVWPGFYDRSVFEQVLLFYLTGKHLAPLWFIPMISIFYLAAPLLVYADKNRSVYYFLPLFVVLSCFVSRGLPPQSFIHFFSAYLLGMYCSNYKNSLNPLISSNLFIYTTLSFVLIFAAFEFLFMERTMTYVNYLQKLTMSIFFLGLFIKHNASLNSEYISTIANTSFGVFFIHSYVLTASKLLYKEYNGELPSGSLTLYCIVALSTLIICSGLVTFIKKICGKYSKLIIGS